MKRISIVLSGLIVSSCLAQQEPADYNANNNNSGTSTTEQGVIRKDSLTVMNLLQSDPTAILMSHVIIKDGVIILDLSEEDAISLGISSELYSSFSQLICPPNEE